MPTTPTDFPFARRAGDQPFDRRRFLDALLAVGLRVDGRRDRVSGGAVSRPAARAASRRRDSAVAGARRRAPAELRGRSSSSAASRASSCAPPRASCARSAPSARTSIAPCSSRRTRRSSGAPATTARTTWAATSSPGPPPRGLEKFTVNLRGEGDDAEIVVSRIMNLQSSTGWTNGST